jgi:hypothetical protein
MEYLSEPNPSDGRQSAWKITNGGQDAKGFRHLSGNIGRFAQLFS